MDACRKRRRLSFRILLLWLMPWALVASSCQVMGDPPAELVVFAASSLTDGLRQVATGYERQQPGARVLVSYASSAQLAVQLSQGARADLFASADPQQMAAAEAAGRIDGEPVVFATNQLILLLPMGNPAGIEELADLGRPGVRLVLATPNTPLRTYTEEALRQLAADPTTPAGLAEAIMTNVVSEEDNARQVVAKIALGEADAAFAYRSDGCSELAQGTTALDLPHSVAIDALYSAAVVQGARHPDRAMDLLDFMISDEGQSILTEACFGPGQEAN